MAAKFDTAKDALTVDELDAVLGPWFASRDASENFAAREVLGLRHEHRPRTLAANTGHQ